ncbi:hypothetical protein PF011_g27563 [Phytophthora fragariae]|uniref:CCHC-type domain-containing protein n=1 Tax=Phytophthora fragariae TaxID=53985 RepID=A0A6A3HF91_9STRA|nr:hypothetical protein PF011_g27563 [Phytophthora fragariae]
MSATDAKTGGGLEKFNGKSYTMWKDKLLTHVNSLDHEYQTKLLEKRQPEAKVLMADFLRSNPEKPASPTTEISEQKMLEMRWDVAHWKRGRGDLQNLLNRVLPNFFLSTLPDVVSSMDPCEVIRLLEKGQGDAAGLIELTRSLTKLTRTPWHDLRTLFAQLKKARNEINRKTRKLFNQDMVSESWLCVEVLSQLPSEYWASSISMTKEDFTVDKVEGALRRIFGEKSKKDVGLMDKTQVTHINNIRTKVVGQKRKPTSTEGDRSCFYCFEAGHFKSDCPAKAADRDPNRQGGPLFRTDIKTAPGAKKAKKVAINTLKAVVAEGQKKLGKDDRTSLEKSQEDQLMDDINSLDPEMQDEGMSAETPPPKDMDEYEAMAEE